MARMTEEELIALTDLEISASVGSYGGKLAEQRRKATAYYLGLPEGDLAPPEVEGRSTVVFPFVRNTIEAMLPQLMVKFTGGDSVVEFEATKPGDEEKAQLCTDYLNYLFWKKNRGHVLAETWMRDALLYKNGIIKVWWDERVEEKKEEYRGLTQVELAEIMDDPEVEVTEGRSYPDEEDAKARQQAIEQMTAQMQQALAAAPQNPQAGAAVQQLQQQIEHLSAQPAALLYDVTAVRKPKGGKLCLENVPPEEFLISRKAKSIADARFCGHRVLRTISELRSMGYKPADLQDLGGDDGEAWNSERTARDNYDGDIGTDDTADESQREVWVNECYIRVDFDGDGIAELRKVTRVGSKVLDNEVCDQAPFVDIVCIRQPHKFTGLSINDLGAETQKTQTSILRSSLDNLYLDVNGRYFAVEGQVNLDDLLTSRPGGVVRIKSQGAVGRLDQARSDLAGSMGMLEFMEGFGESATGWTRYSQGNSAGKLAQSTATGMNIVANRDDMRVDLIARNFAEGFVELFRQMLKLVCQYQDKKTAVRLTGGWVDIDPREWKNQFDVSINVGLGVGNKDQQIQQILAVIAQQEKVFAIGAATGENIYNASADLAKLTGQKNGDRYFTDPTKNPPAQKPDPEMVKGQVQAQLEQIKGQTTVQVEQAKIAAQMQLEREKMQLQAQVDANEQQQQAQQKTIEQQMQAELERYKTGLELQAEAARMQHELAIKQLEIENENARKAQDNEVKLAIAELQANVQAAGIQSGEKMAAKDAETKVAVAKTSAAAKPKPEKKEPDKAGAEIGEIKRLMTELHAQATAPKQVVRDEAGKAIAIKHGDATRVIKRDKEGRITGV